MYPAPQVHSLSHYQHPIPTSVFVTADETERMPQCHPRPQFALGFTPGGAHSMGVDECGTRICDDSVIRSIFTVLNIPRVCLSPSPYDH